MSTMMRVAAMPSAKATRRKDQLLFAIKIVLVLLAIGFITINFAAIEFNATAGKMSAIQQPES